MDTAAGLPALRCLLLLIVSLSNKLVSEGPEQIDAQLTFRPPLIVASLLIVCVGRNEAICLSIAIYNPCSQALGALHKIMTLNHASAMITGWEVLQGPDSINTD